MLQAILAVVNAVQNIINQHESFAVTGMDVQKKLLQFANRTLPKRVRGPKLQDGLTKEEANYASQGRNSNGYSSGKIEAIKLYRTRTGSGLKEAKDAVEDWMERNLGYRHAPTVSKFRPENLDVHKNGNYVGTVKVFVDNQHVYPLGLPAQVKDAINQYVNGNYYSTYINHAGDYYQWSPVVKVAA